MSSGVHMLIVTVEIIHFVVGWHPYDTQSSLLVLATGIAENTDFFSL